MADVAFTFSDLVAGYATDFDEKAESFTLTTPGGEVVRAQLGANVYGELVRNLGEGYQDSSGQMRQMLGDGRFVFAYGIYYPESSMKFEVKHLIFVGRDAAEYRFEAQDWWVRQIAAIADFWLQAQFPDGVIDYAKYRTSISVSGEQVGALRQETDTISRLVYGFASAYMLTGNERYLEAAEKGTEYLRDHLRFIDESRGIVYWYHALDLKGQKERKVFASEFGDDYDAIPAYEQIYALAGPTQTYRITGDQRILRDIRMTVALFDRYFLDHDKGGYFSHVDPITFDPRSEALGGNRARKNWNSVGDHAPAYLINAVLATGDKALADMLAYTGDTIEARFKDYEHSPFVQEKFHEDWSHDQTWGWQQNRGVVGHNLKIAWNLMRIHHMRANTDYVAFARKIAELMPAIGGDGRRGGWYDVMERTRQAGQEFHRFAWHDRKAWWQQEQGILAYLILAGSLGDEQYKKLARESMAFYNAFFLDNETGGVYFNVLANGIPYLMGTERMKGSHSMSGYHSTELCYLAAVYSNLLVTKKPLDLYFKPRANGFEDNVLRVAPDFLPVGSVKIADVWVDGVAYADFDPVAMTVNLPRSEKDLRVRVRLMPTSMAKAFSSELEMDGSSATLSLMGELTAESLPALRAELARVTRAQPSRLVIDASDLDAIDAAAVRALVVAKQKLDIDADVALVGASLPVAQVFKDEEVFEELVAGADLGVVEASPRSA
ncbi:MAG: AGE family epimerase/isomerase [Chloroflexota bacterium]